MRLSSTLLRTAPPLRRTLAGFLLPLLLAGGLRSADLPIETCAGELPRLLRDIAQLDYGTDPVASPQDGFCGPAILVVSATAEHLHALLGQREELGRFCQGGGWVLLSGLDQSGLADFDQLVGVQHLLRSFLREKVVPTSDPLASGLLPEDVAMNSRANSWSDIQIADDAYGMLVDTENIATFAKLPDYTYFKHPNADTDHDPVNLVDGFLSQDSWKRVFAMYPSRTPLSFPLVLPRPTLIHDIVLTTSMIYPGIGSIEFTFDGEDKRTLTTSSAGANRLDIDPPRKVTTIQVRVAKYQCLKDDVIGIDDISIHHHLPPEWTSQVHPLTNVGALVSPIPRVLAASCCASSISMTMTATSTIPDAACASSASCSSICMPAAPHRACTPCLSSPTSARGRPIAIDAQAQSIAPHQGLLGEQAELVLPSGMQVLGGISCACGSGRRAVIARSDHARVMPLGASADALTFLQAADYGAGASGRRLGCYRVVYADGGVCEVPVVAGRDLGLIQQQQPEGVERAQLAWTAGGGPQATALYLRQWDNPRPGSIISTVELVAEDPTAAIAVFSMTAL